MAIRSYTIFLVAICFLQQLPRWTDCQRTTRNENQQERLFDCCSCPRQIVPQANCTVDIQSYSAHQTESTRGFVRLNGREIWSAGWTTEHPNKRGINTIVIDPFRCTHSGTRQWDTWDSAESTYTLIEYVQYVRDGAVLVGVTGDEPTRNLAPAHRMLSALGLPVGHMRERGNFVFIMQKGFIEKALMRSSATNAMTTTLLNVRIQGSAVDDLTFTVL